MKNHNRPFINYEEIEPPQKQKEKVESQNTSIPFIDIDELRPQEKKEKVNPQSFFLNIDDIRPRTAQSEPVKRDLDPKRVLETGDYGDGGLDIMTFGAAKKEKKPTPQEEWKIPDFFSNNGSSNKTEISDESTKENAGIVQAPDGAQDVTKPESFVDDDSQLDVQHGEAPSIDKQEVSTNPSANEAFAGENQELLTETNLEQITDDKLTDEVIDGLHDALDSIDAQETKKEDGSIIDVDALSEALDEIEAESRRESFMDRWNRRRLERVKEEHERTNDRIRALGKIAPFLVPKPVRDELSGVGRVEERPSSSDRSEAKVKVENSKDQASSNDIATTKEQTLYTENDVEKNYSLSEEDEKSLTRIGKNLKEINAFFRSIPAEKIPEDLKKEFYRKKQQASYYKTVGWLGKLSSKERTDNLKKLLGKFGSSEDPFVVSDEEKNYYENLKKEVKGIKESTPETSWSKEQIDKINELRNYKVAYWLNNLSVQERSEMLSRIRNRFDILS